MPQSMSKLIFRAHLFNDHTPNALKALMKGDSIIPLFEQSCFTQFQINTYRRVGLHFNYFRNESSLSADQLIKLCDFCLINREMMNCLTLFKVRLSPTWNESVNEWNKKKRKMPPTQHSPYLAEISRNQWVTIRFTCLTHSWIKRLEFLNELFQSKYVARAFIMIFYPFVLIFTFFRIFK